MPAPLPPEVTDFLTRFHAETGTPGVAARLAEADRTTAGLRDERDGLRVRLDEAIAEGDEI